MVAEDILDPQYDYEDWATSCHCPPPCVKWYFPDICEFWELFAERLHILEALYVYED